MGHHVFDTSALVKLVLAEPETDALRRWLAATAPQAAASELARTELTRAVLRAAPDRLSLVPAVLGGLALLPITRGQLERAGRLEPPHLRTLDAVHLAAALDLGDDLEAMVTYDDRLADAARANGVPVVAPT